MVNLASTAGQLTHPVFFHITQGEMSLGTLPKPGKGFCSSGGGKIFTSTKFHGPRPYSDTKQESSPPIPATAAVAGTSAAMARPSVSRQSATLPVFTQSPHPPGHHNSPSCTYVPGVTHIIIWAAASVSSHSVGRQRSNGGISSLMAGQQLIHSFQRVAHHIRTAWRCQAERAGSLYVCDVKHSRSPASHQTASEPVSLPEEEQVSWAEPCLCPTNIPLAGQAVSAWQHK